MKRKDIFSILLQVLISNLWGDHLRYSIYTILVNINFVEYHQKNIPSKSFQLSQKFRDYSKSFQLSQKFGDYSKSFQLSQKFRDYSKSFQLTQKFRDYSKFRMKTNCWWLIMQVCIKKTCKTTTLTEQTSYSWT
jgi:hypothetical protein